MILTVNKIIGFTISIKPICHDDVDVFDVGLRVIEKFESGLWFYFWGIGDLEKSVIDNLYTLSFPRTKSLNDRNVLINVGKDSVVIENDWLGSIPVFYNKSNIIISTLPLKCIHDDGVDEEGLSYYLRHGYTQHGVTYRKGVRQLRYCSRLDLSGSSLQVSKRPDPVVSMIKKGIVADERHSIKAIQEDLNKLENNSTGNIIIPTSGGYDSRLLNALITNKDRINSYTYGVSKSSGQCFQVQYAKELSARLGTKWQEIRFGDFWDDINPWFRLYGQATHLHGMYQIDFYRKIRKIHGEDNCILLSGIVGDAWAGNKIIDEINTYKDLDVLSLSYGVNIEKKNILVSEFMDAQKHEYDEISDFLKFPAYRLVAMVRTKLALLSYLTQLPEYFGFIAYSPFLSFEIVEKMLSIPKDRWDKRKWQKEYFMDNNLDVERANLKDVQHYNDVMSQTFNRHDFEPLDIGVLDKYVRKSHLNAINKRMKKNSILANSYNSLMESKWPEKIMRRVFGKKRAYIEYMILKGLEMGLKYNGR